MAYDNPPPGAFRDYLLEKLSILGGTQEDFAAMIGVSKGSVSRWLNDGLQPKYPTMKKIAHGLGVSLEEVIDAVEGRYKPMTRAEREALQISKDFTPEGITLAYQELAKQADQQGTDIIVSLEEEAGEKRKVKKR